MIAFTDFSRIHSSALVIGFTAISAVFSSGISAQVTLTASSWVPPGHVLTKDILTPYAAEIEKVTQGRVKIQILPKAPMSAPGTFDGVREGAVDLSYVVASYTPGRHVVTKLPELPGGGHNAETNSVAYSRIYWKHLNSAGEYKGVKLLGVFTHGPGYLYVVNKPVSQLSDLQGMKLRVAGGIPEEMGKALGAAPFLKPASESYELLSGGVADGTLLPAESIVSFKLDKLIKHVTTFPGGLYSVSFAMFMNEDKWNKLSKADQDAITAISGEKLARMAGQAWDKADRVGLDAMKANNINVINPSPAFTREIQERAIKVEKDWIEQVKTKGIDGAKMLAEFREEIKRVVAGQ